MASSDEREKNDITHVCINFALQPKDLLRVEGLLRLHFNDNITCLFSCSKADNLGIFVPNPFGFKKDPYKFLGEAVRCTPHIDHIKSSVTNTLTRLTHKPFFDVTRSCVDDCLNGLDNILILMSDWFMEPISPDNKFTYNDYKSIAHEYECCDSDDEVDSQCGQAYNIVESCWSNDFIMKESDEPHMSYNDRVTEAHTIIDMDPDLHWFDTYTCFKLPNNYTLNKVMDIMDDLPDDMGPYGLDTHYVPECGSLKFLMLGYEYIGSDEDEDEDEKDGI